MTSLPVRDPLDDHLLTPQNAALELIDYQDAEINSIPEDPENYVPNVVALAKVGRLFGLPVVLSTVNHGTGVNGDTIPQARGQLPGVPTCDRTSINAWEDAEFVAAVRATGLNKLDHRRIVDRSLPGVPGAGRHHGRLRGVPGGRCGGRHKPSDS
jgi:hypothetical protein